MRRTLGPQKKRVLGFKPIDVHSLTWGAKSLLVGFVIVPFRKYLKICMRNGKFSMSESFDSLFSDLDQKCYAPFTITFDGG